MYNREGEREIERERESESSWLLLRCADRHGSAGPCRRRPPPRGRVRLTPWSAERDKRCCLGCGAARLAPILCPTTLLDVTGRGAPLCTVLVQAETTSSRLSSHATVKPSRGAGRGGPLIKIGHGPLVHPVV